MRRKLWGIWVYVEQQVQVRPTRFRVPDICAVLGSRSEDPILRTPPFFCIEILSKDDTFSSLRERIDDYLAFGVPYVWMIEAVTRRAWQCTGAGLLEVAELRTESPEIVVPLIALFED